MTDAPTTPDPIEIAMEAEASGVPPLGVAGEFLAAQKRLVDWQIANERAAFVLKLILGLAALALVAGAVWTLWDASRADGTQIEPFDTAPALAARGLTGEAIANELRARLAEFEGAAGAMRPGRETSSRADEIAVLIPQTGVSVGEVQRLLRAWLGHETHVSGALRPAETGGLELTLRVGGRRVAVTPPPEPLRGSADAWLDAAAEAAMREVDPYRYSVRLRSAGRTEEAEALLWRLARAGPPADRVWGWTGLGALLRARGDFQGAIAVAQAGLAVSPTVAQNPGNLADLYAMLGRDEAARAWARQALATARNDERRAVPLWSTRAKAWDNDWLAVWRDTEARMSVLRWGSTDFPPSVAALRGRTLARLHEPVRAQQMLHGSDPLGNAYAPAAWIDLLAEWQRWDELSALLARPWSPDVPPGHVRAIDPTLRWPWQAWLAAREDRVDAAREIAGRTPLDCYLCLRMRGRIEMLAGQPAAADRWFAEAVRQGPSLADAELEWAQAKLARGDRAGALALAREAVRKAPNWADPRKLEGDLLALAGDDAGALRSYATAAKLAPRWGALHTAWGAALARRGELAAARARWTAAARMDLNPAERAELDRVRR